MGTSVISNLSNNLNAILFSILSHDQGAETFPKQNSTKEGNSKGGENDGRLLIGFYYSAVTGNRKQVLTGSSESCEHKCRWNTLSFKLQVLFES